MPCAKVVALLLRVFKTLSKRAHSMIGAVTTLCGMELQLKSPNICEEATTTLHVS